MLRILPLLALSLFILRCQGDPPPAKEAVEPPGPAFAEVLVVSKPANAGVFLDGALMGKTPMPVKVNGEMRLELRLEGHENKEITLTTGTGPNLIVELQASQAAGEAADAGVVGAGDESDDDDAKVSDTPKNAGFSTFSAAKAAYQSGKITKGEYKQVVTKIKVKLQAQLERHKDAYKKGNITKDEYNRRVLKSKLLFEG